MKFDELNRLEDDYFEPMAISTEDKKRRRELCELLTDVFLYFFSVYEVHLMYNNMLERALYEQLLTDKISDAVSEVTGIDSEMSNHIRTLAKEVVDTTYKNVSEDYKVTQVRQDSPKISVPFTSTALENTEESSVSPKTSGDSTLQDQDQGQESDYWLSITRATMIARNEANTFLNYTDFTDAKDRGKTVKTWWAMPDNKVRETHVEVEGQTIGIDEYFRVGNSQMRFPHDWVSSPDPKEVINCRCAVEYK